MAAGVSGAPRRCLKCSKGCALSLQDMQEEQNQTQPYDEVSDGTTGHAEVIRIEYDPSVVFFRDLLTVFFATHDPGTVNRQGNDVGTQYRSIILYTNETQKREAAFHRGSERVKQKGLPAVTESESASRVL